MLTPEQIAALRDAAGQVADPITEYLIRDIARRVAEAGQLTSTAAYQVWRAQNLGLSQREVKRRLSKLLHKSMREIDRLMTQAAEVGYDFDLSNLPYVQALPFDRSPVMQQLLAAAVELAREDFTNLTQTLGMVDPLGNALPLQDAYYKACDFAFEQTFTGAADYNTAVRQACANLAAQGVRVIDYESGVHTSLEAAVRRNIMGGMGLMAEQITQYNHDALGADGWEISAHAASAPDHEPIQGRQYTDAQYTALNGSLKRRIGTLNCGHAAFPIILGVSQPQYSKDELRQMREDNARGVTYEGRHYTGYEATQKQRQVERAIRAQKRRVMVSEATGDAEKLTVDRIRLQRLNQEYARFSVATGQKTQRERAQVAGFGRGQAARAQAAYRSEVVKYAAVRYNKDGTIVVTDDWTQRERPRVPQQYKPNAVIDTASKGGKQHDRTIYDANGRMIMQIHGGDHGHPKQHPYGRRGEHIHDYIWPEGAGHPKRTAREATESERRQNADILRGDEDDRQ